MGVGPSIPADIVLPEKGVGSYSKQRSYREISMAYEVIARKWRPQQFDDVVGQAHVTDTLKNAITADRIAHAYLFVGPSNVGKATAARLFGAEIVGAGDPVCAQVKSDRVVAAVTGCAEIATLAAAAGHPAHDHAGRPT